MERAEVTTLLVDPNKDRLLHHRLVAEYGERQGQKLFFETAQKDFLSQAWELSAVSLPLRFSYRRIEAGDQVRLVHDSDLASGADIISKIHPQVRRGTEFTQALKYRQAMLQAEIGQSVIWISPKKERGEADCVYPDTQINIAFKKDQNTIEVRQFQSGDLNTGQSALLFNRLAGQQILGPEAVVDQVITAVGVKDGFIETELVKEAVAQITGRKMGREGINETEVMEQIKKLSGVNARRYLEAIQLGVAGQSLRDTHADLLLNTISGLNSPKVRFENGGFVMEMSCGAMGGSINSKKSVSQEGEKIKCKSCGFENFSCGQALSSCRFCEGRLN